MKIYELLKKTPKAQAPKAALNAAANVFYIYDVIGDFFGVRAKDFKDFIENNAESSEIHIHINSPGGSVFEGRAIASLIRSFKGKTVCHVDGLAASAASVVAVACDEVVMALGSMLMIHNAWMVAIGNKKELLDQIDLLEKCDESIATDYEMKSGLPREEIIAMMDAETWLTAEEAVEKHFADRIDEKAQKQDTSTFNLAAYDHAPEQLLKEESKATETPQQQEPDYEAIRQANERRLQLYRFV